MHRQKAARLRSGVRSESSRVNVRSLRSGRQFDNDNLVSRANRKVSELSSAWKVTSSGRDFELPGNSEDDLQFVEKERRRENVEYRSTTLTSMRNRDKHSGSERKVESTSRVVDRHYKDIGPERNESSSKIRNGKKNHRNDNSLIRDTGSVVRQEKTYFGRRQYPGKRNISDIEATPSIVKGVKDAMLKAQEEGYVEKDKKKVEGFVSGPWGAC